MRDLYEVPAAALILTAHKELEKLVCTIHQNTFKPQLDLHWAYLVYAGLWYEPLTRPERVHGRRQRAGDGRDHGAALQGQRAARCPPLPNALYDPRAGGLRRVGRFLLQQASPGFIELWSLQSRWRTGCGNRGREDS